MQRVACLQPAQSRGLCKVASASRRPLSSSCITRAAATDAPARISATDRVKLGDSDLSVSGKQLTYC